MYYQTSVSMFLQLGEVWIQIVILLALKLTEGSLSWDVLVSRIFILQQPPAARQQDIFFKTCFNSKRKRFPKTEYTKRFIELLIVTSKFETCVRGTASTLKASKILDTIAKKLQRTNIKTTTICIIAKLCCSLSNW